MDHAAPQHPEAIDSDEEACLLYDGVLSATFNLVTTACQRGLPDFPRPSDPLIDCTASRAVSATLRSAAEPQET